ncbi:formylglycine-generating enzyme family protein [Aquiflexum sp.]|uniref:formylglycine-generating enzyme family protein n=1 Tax=Aquiflexum sp. TaxID=1872584 RepID=UPI0035948A5B
MKKTKISEIRKMVLIPSGKFQMVGTSQKGNQDEFPKHDIEVKSFMMDIHEVTNTQFKSFVDETGYVSVAERPIIWEEFKKQLPKDYPKPPDDFFEPGALVFFPTEGPVKMDDIGQWWKWVKGANWKQPEGPSSNISNKMDHPVVQVAYEDANAYAKWAGKRLPTESEWEWAARGGLENPIYPWGNESIAESTLKANFWQGFFPYENKGEDGFIGTAPVMSFDSNGYGLYDMAGNVWEWCEDWYHAEAYSQKKDNIKKGPETSYDPQEPNIPKRVIRGGSFLCNDSYCSGYRVSRRMKSSEDSGLNHTGFRCVKD